MSTLDEYKKIMADLRGGKFKPVYVLHGEEGFFIDRIAMEVERLALEDHERDFNQTILYGRDADPDTVKDTCLRYPMMAERQLVVVRELQNWRIDQVEKLEAYRIAAELRLILREPDPAATLQRLARLGVLDALEGLRQGRICLGRPLAKIRRILEAAGR